MPRFAITTNQVPPGSPGAFNPIPTTTEKATSGGRIKVNAAPGTIRVPSPRPAALNDSALGGPYNQPSSVAPDWFCPALHVEHINQLARADGTMRLVSDNVLPVPGYAPGRSALPLIHKQRIGGRTVTASPRPFLVWPTYTSGRNAAFPTQE